MAMKTGIGGWGLGISGWRTQAREKEVQRLFVFFAVGIGIGIAFGIEIAIDGHLDADSDIGIP